MELYKKALQTPLTKHESQQVFQALVVGQLTTEQIKTLLLALNERGETAEEIAGAAQALLSAAQPFKRPKKVLVDTCGTGGDGQNTINISTAAALVAASMGEYVAKHGNRSVSSRSGSADVLESLHLPIQQNIQQVSQQLNQHRFGFLFAPYFHPGIKHAMPARQQLGSRTLFNLLGPLVNPARPQVQLVGVYDPNLSFALAETLQLLACERAMVVHGSGLDEIALHGITYVTELKAGQLSQYELTPEDFGLTPRPLAALRGGDANENAACLTAVFTGQGQAAHQEAITMNVAALLYMRDRYPSLKEATQAVLSHLESGAVARYLKQIKLKQAS